MALAPDAIPAHHFDAGFSTGCDRGQYGLHATVEKVSKGTAASGLICDTFQFGGWDICDEHLSMLGWLPSDLLRDVSNGEIYRIRCLATEKCQLGLVGGNDHWDDSGARSV